MQQRRLRSSQTALLVAAASHLDSSAGRRGPRRWQVVLAKVTVTVALLLKDGPPPRVSLLQQGSLQRSCWVRSFLRTSRENCHVRHVQVSSSLFHTSHRGSTVHESHYLDRRQCSTQWKACNGESSLRLANSTAATGTY